MPRCKKVKVMSENPEWPGAHHLPLDSIKGIKVSGAGGIERTDCEWLTDAGMLCRAQSANSILEVRRQPDVTHLSLSSLGKQERHICVVSASCAEHQLPLLWLTGKCGEPLIYKADGDGLVQSRRFSVLKEHKGCLTLEEPKFPRSRRLGWEIGLLFHAQEIVLESGISEERVCGSWTLTKVLMALWLIIGFLDACSAKESRLQRFSLPALVVWIPAKACQLWLQKLKTKVYLSVSELYSCRFLGRFQVRGKATLQNDQGTSNILVSYYI